MAELLIGQHCAVDHCNQIDFLPFKCDGCSAIFCLEHRSTEAHGCPVVEMKQESSTTVKSEVTVYHCSKLDCKSKEPVPVICQFCTLQFCLSHRHAQDHDCAKMPRTEKPVPMAKTAEMVKEIQARQQANPRKNKPKSEKARKMAAKVALMKMKIHAEGDSGIPERERVYLDVHLPSQSSVQSKPFFFSSLSSIGRIVDSLADSLKLENQNDKRGSEKLKLFHSDTGRALAMDTKLKHAMESETDPLYSGGQVTLEYVRDGTDDLQVARK